MNTLRVEIYHLYWNNVHQITTTNRTKIIEILFNGVVFNSCWWGQYKLTSNYIDEYDIIKFVDNK